MHNLGSSVIQADELSSCISYIYQTSPGTEQICNVNSTI